MEAGESNPIRKQNMAFRSLQEIPQEIIDEAGKMVEELDLTHNKLSDLKFLVFYPNLKSLVLDHNNITSNVKMPEMPYLHTLWVNHNQIKNLDTLRNIHQTWCSGDMDIRVFLATLSQKCPNMKILSMMNNEAAPSYFNGGTYEQYMDYRHYTISQLPHLEVLDDTKVTPQERAEACRIYRMVTVSKTRKKSSKRQRSSSFQEEDKQT